MAAEDLKPHQWKPGQSGNPAGYSRGRRTTDALLRLIDESNADKAIARVWLKSILEGDFRYFKEFLERTEGKTVDSLNITATEAPAQPDDSTKRAAANILKDLGIARADPVLPTQPDGSPTGLPGNG